ncbi:MAG TPA: class I SAM-dependent methyltransferase [Steroidobacteraceae bacterium]|nr:class I SAM-dependent methyltransferase [Steroidobacteraceae bacterium]
MSAITDHYERILAPIYLWMAGGAEAAHKLGAADLSALDIRSSKGETAVDLGAGFGMHAVPLAQLRYSVTALDSSSWLLEELRKLAGGLNIRAIQYDLLDFPTHLKGQPVLILCMGDTLAHLSSLTDVERLFSEIAGALAPGGRFITTFCDYTSPARGDARFIPVRSDADRIHTCFLEQEPDRILVHDVVHERHEGTWSMRASHYPKLRLAPGFVVTCLQTHGIEVARGSGPRGMARISAVRRSRPSPGREG